MERWIRFSGIIGLVLLAFGFIGSMIIDSFENPLLLLHLLLGVVLLVVWFVVSGVKNLREAGGYIRGRGARFGASAIVYSALFIGIVVAVNWLANRHNKRWDLTEEGAYSLSDQTTRVLSALKDPLLIVGFKVTDEPERLEDLLSLYRSHNPSKVTTKVIDPRVNPEPAIAYDMKQQNVIYLEYGTGDKKAVSRINYQTEDALTNAIIKLTRGAAKKIYYVEGHGEPDLEHTGEGGMKSFAGAIGDENLSIDSIILSKMDSVPEDAAAVILAAPQKALLPEERDLLIKYVEGGGRLVLFADLLSGRNKTVVDDLRHISSHFKVQIGNDVVIDQIERPFAAPALGAQPMVNTYPDHPLTKGLTQRHLTVFNVASTVKAPASPEGEATFAEIVKTRPTAWAETNIDLVFAMEPSAVREDTDVGGPVPLAVAYERKLPAGEKKEGEEASFEKVSRLVVFGDSDFVLNGNLNVYANRDLALNAVNWIVGEEGGIAIRPRSVKASIAPIPQHTLLTLLATSFVIPELILILGLWVWWQRRQLSFQ
jgi:ABC-type uncharacterized transport system involved in gliding motility auxiliary subunit